MTKLLPVALAAILLSGPAYAVSQEAPPKVAVFNEHVDTSAYQEKVAVFNENVDTSAYQEKVALYNDRMDTSPFVGEVLLPDSLFSRTQPEKGTRGADSHFIFWNQHSYFLEGTPDEDKEGIPEEVADWKPLIPAGIHSRSPADTIRTPVDAGKYNTANGRTGWERNPYRDYFRGPVWPILNPSIPGHLAIPDSKETLELGRMVDDGCDVVHQPFCEPFGEIDISALPTLLEFEYLDWYLTTMNLEQVQQDSEAESWKRSGSVQFAHPFGTPPEPVNGGPFLLVPDHGSPEQAQQTGKCNMIINPNCKDSDLDLAGIRIIVTVTVEKT